MESSIQYNVLLIFVLCLMCGFSQSGDVSLKIEPRYLRLNLDTTIEAKVMCTFRDSSGRNVPLTGCQFIVDGYSLTWDFSMGPSSPQSSSFIWQGMYHGRGLQHGECGITVTGFRQSDRPILGCRVKSAVVDSWIYEAMMVYADYQEPMQFNLQPHVTLAKAGSDVTFNGVAEHGLDRCYFDLLLAHTVLLDFYKGRASKEQHQARYHGDGLQHKQCGITMMNVLPERSGFVKGLVSNYTSPLRTSYDYVTLIVLTAPEAPPLLTVNTTGLLAPGSVLHATCVVKNSRPVANLTWFLGDDVIRNDNINEAPLDLKWRWIYDLQTIEQHLEHVMTLSDNGKQLKCKASHVSLASGSQDSTSHVVLVRDPCLPNPCGDNSVCHVIRDEADCNCKEHFIGSPPSCRPECSINADCTSLRACVDSRCLDPCSSISCGGGAQCHVAQHVAECKCLDGLVGDPLILCKDPCQNNPCGVNGECYVETSVKKCRCQEHFVGDPPFCRPECSINDECSSLTACVDARCVDPCNSTSCGDGAQCHVAQHVAECM